MAWAWHSLPAWFIDRFPNVSKWYSTQRHFVGSYLSRDLSTAMLHYFDTVSPLRDVAVSPLRDVLMPPALRRMLAQIRQLMEHMDDPFLRKQKSRQTSYTRTGTGSMLNQQFNDTIMSAIDEFTRALLCAWPYLHVITVPVFQLCHDALETHGRTYNGLNEASTP